MAGTHEAVCRLEHLMELAIPYSGEDPIDALVDLVTDIKLYCAVTDGANWPEIERIAQEHCEYELFEEQEASRLHDDYEAYLGQM